MCEGVRICFSFTQLPVVREDSSSIFTHRCHGWQHLFRDVRIDTSRRTND